MALLPRSSLSRTDSLLLWGALGVGLGSALENLVVGIAIGLAMGFAFSSPAFAGGPAKERQDDDPAT